MKIFLKQNQLDNILHFFQNELDHLKGKHEELKEASKKTEVKTNLIGVKIFRSQINWIIYFAFLPGQA